MELVEGEDLAQRLTHGAIPIDEALPIAKQIAEALEAAHEQGIIHRDLKPANVKLREDGTVKVLDFGLAKAMESTSVASSVQLTNSPTITSPALMTGIGVLLGTVAYMSPEQAKGRPADRRSDVWAFGCVLYEMLTGTRAFRGNDVTDTLVEVLRAEPLWSELPRDVPASVRHVLRLCLQKDPKQRIQAIGDVRLVLDGALGDSDAPPADQDRGWRRWTVRTIAAGALVLMGSCVGWFVGRTVPQGGSAPPTRILRLSVDLPSTERLADLDDAGDQLCPVSLSPDGQTIVYTAVRGGVRQLFHRRLDQGVATPIPGTEGARVSFFSPDGRTIGFNTDADLKKVALAGGEPVVVRKLWVTTGISSASWGDDGTMVIGLPIWGNPLWRLPASSGEPSELTSVTKRGDLKHVDPAHLPGDRGLLYSASGRIILRTQDGTETVLTEGRSPRFVTSGHIVFLRNQSLWAMPFDLTSAVAGGPVKIADGVAGSFAVSADGTLVYVGGRQGAAQLVWVDASGREQVVAGVPTGAYGDAVLSPDGGRIALTIRTPDQTMDIFVYDLGRQNLRPITAEGGFSVTNAPLWTVDGKQLVFTSNRNSAGRNLFQRAADGTGPFKRLTTSPHQQAPWSWSKDGQTLLFTQLNSDTSFDIFSGPIDALDQSLPLVQTKEADLYPAVSPDGRLLAYWSGGQVWVSPFPNVSESHLQVSTTGGVMPKWSRDGRTLFFSQTGSGIMAATVISSPSLVVSVPRLVVKGEYLSLGGIKHLDIGPDGRFLLLKPVPAEPSIQVVLNWTEELKRLVPTK
jgi:serine/threonine-protein kinase